MENQTDSKKYILDIEIRNIDGDSVYVQDKSVSVEVAGVAKKDNSLMIYGIILVVAILIASFIYQIFKNKKK